MIVPRKVRFGYKNTPASYGRWNPVTDTVTDPPGATDAGEMSATSVIAMSAGGVSVKLADGYGVPFGLSKHWATTSHRPPGKCASRVKVLDAVQFPSASIGSPVMSRNCVPFRTDTL